MSCPNKKPAPRGDNPHPSISSGSLHRRSHMAPSVGTSCLRSSNLILSMVSTRGESPPCTQNTAPDSVDELWDEFEAPDPGGPVLRGVGGEVGNGEEESGLSLFCGKYLFLG